MDGAIVYIISCPWPKNWVHFFHSLCHYHTFAICLHDIKRDQLLQKEEWCNPFSYPLNKLQHQRMKAFFTPMQSATYSINLHNGVKFILAHCFLGGQAMFWDPNQSSASKISEKNGLMWQTRYRGVSSVPFPFQFPF